MDGLTHADVAELDSDLKEPATPVGKEVATKVKRSLYDTVTGILGAVKDTSESVKGVFNPGQPAPQNLPPAAPTDSKGFNKMIIIAVAVVVLLLVLLFATQNNASTSKKIVK